MRERQREARVLAVRGRDGRQHRKSRLAWRFPNGVYTRQCCKSRQLSLGITSKREIEDSTGCR